MIQRKEGEEECDKENMPRIGKSMCKGLEGKESLFPETTSNSVYLKKITYLGRRWELWRVMRLER